MEASSDNSSLSCSTSSDPWRCHEGHATLDGKKRQPYPLGIVRFELGGGGIGTRDGHVDTHLGTQ